MDISTELFLPQTYSAPLVVLSILIAIFSSFTAFGTAERQHTTDQTSHKIIWNVFGATTMALGIWAMHFIGMLALKLPTTVSYDLSRTVISVIPAIGACSAVLWIMTQESNNRMKLLVGGLLLGSGIGVMHHIGMSAMQMNAIMSHNMPLLFISILFAVVFATIALNIQYQATSQTHYQFLNRKQLISSLFMGLSVSGMHYLAMAATNFTLENTQELTGIEGDTLSLIVGISILIILVFAVIIPNLFRYKQLIDQLSHLIDREKEDKTRIQVIMDSALDALIQINSKGEIIGWSYQAEQIFGWKDNEIIGKELYKELIPLRYQDLLQLLEKAKKSNVNRKVQEQTALHRDSHEFPIEIGIASRKVNDKYEFNAFIRDISRRKALEKEKDHNNKRLANKARQLEFQKNALDAHAIVSITDFEGNITYANQKFCDISGYSINELIGENHRLIKSDFHPNSFFEEMWQTISRGEIWHGQIKNLSQSGTAYWVQSSIIPFLNKQGTPEQYIAIRTDITYIKELEEKQEEDNKALSNEKQIAEIARVEAENANKAKSTFLSNMSHELRTPMHGILSFSNFGIENSNSESRENIHTYFENIHTCGERLLDLLNDLLDLSKLEMNKMELNIKKGDLANLFKSCQLEQQQRIVDLGLTINTNISSPVTGQFDVTRIGQVITNILSNAIKFSPKNSTITITIAKETNVGLSFSLQDQGLGLPEDELEQIFDAFIQSSKTTSKSGGTGLGLAICKNIIEQHNGKIWAENNLENGAIFKFVIPESQD